MDLRYMRNVFGIFNLLLCLIYVPAAVADYAYQGVDQHATVTQSFSISDEKAIPGQWMKLGAVNMNTAQSVPLGSTSPCGYDNLWCTGGEITLYNTGRANYILYVTRTPVTVKDDAGNSYQLTVAFPDSNLVIGVSERNNQGGNRWNTTAGLTSGTGAGRFDQPQESQDALETPVTPAQGWCGAPASVGCPYNIAAYPHTTSGMPYIYLKLPKNLAARTINFTNQPVLKLKMSIGRKQAGKNVVTPDVYLYLSGTISVPQRCYIKADKNNFSFGTVYSNNANGLQGQPKTMTLTTDCYYAPDNQQSLKMEALSGGQLTDGNKIYQIAATAAPSSQKALGIVFSINGNADCNATSTGQNEFNKEYLINNITYQQHYSKTDKVNFALCKYGVPATTDIGQKNIVLRLTSRWVATSS